MLTWLDEWCDGMGLRRREVLAENGKQPDKLCKNDGLAARAATFDALQASLSLNASGRDVPLPIASLSAFAPFFNAPSLHPIVRAFQVTAELVDQFQIAAELAGQLRGIDLNDEATSYTRRMVDPTWTTYIDVPTGLIEVGDLSELRAVFVQPATLAEQPTAGEGKSEDEVLMYSAVVTPKGLYGWRNAMWTDDRSQFVCNNVRLPSIHPEEAAMPTFDEILRRARMPAEQFQNVVEWLTHQVVTHAEDPTRARGDFLPQLPAENDRRIRGRGGDVAKRFSLFRVKRLTPVRRDQEAQAVQGAEARVVEVAGQRRAWRLDHRVTVRAHERRQPFGPRGAGQRKVIQIRQHEKGPVDGLPLHPLERV